MPDLKIIKEFPDNFTFGVATSSYQIEGNSFGNSGLSHWDHFSKIKGNVYNYESGKVACANLPNYKEDIKLIAEAGFSAYRFSFSWPRILPDGKGSINKEGISFYDKLIDELLENNLKTFSTLYHWDLPEIFMSKGGWKNRDTTKWFADFTDIIMRKFSDRLNSIATINEPWCVSWLSHYLGEHAPGERSIESGVKTMHMILVAHAEAMQVIRSHNYNNAGIVLNKQFVQPFDDIPETLKVTNLADEIHNLWFDEAIFKGSYPTQTIKLFSKYMPDNFEEDLKFISQPLDWVGVNYYTRSIIKVDKSETFLGYKSVKGDLIVTDMGWEVFPEGLKNLIERLHNKYSKNVPIFITENGMANRDCLKNGKINDFERIKFYSDHLKQCKKLIEKDIPLKGYFAWSLLDNFEWAYGYSKRFGIVYVDFDNLERIPKLSWKEFKKNLTNMEN